MSKTKEVLVRARAFIEKGWTQGLMACDELGERCKPRSLAATRWCSIGALVAATPPDTTTVWGGWGAETLLRECANSSIVEFNDARGRTKEEVLALFDEAIAAAEGE